MSQKKDDVNRVQNVEIPKNLNNKMLKYLKLKGILIK